MADAPAPAGKPRPRILSGVQSSGRLHLGNYFGAIKQHIELQDVGDCYYFIADLHSLTTMRDPGLMKQLDFDAAVTYLAFGLDPERTVFYRQSDVPEVAEMTWILSCVTGMGLLERAHSYKEKVAKGLTPNAGLFLYPVLMACDILGPQADVVPVGADQKQHVEMARDIAQAFNSEFADPDNPVLKLPEARFSSTPKVPGTTFDKGEIVQVTTELALRKSDGTPVDADAYACSFREMLLKLVDELGPEETRTTEQLEVLIGTAHAAQFADVTVNERALRVTATDPGSHVHVVAKPDAVGLEFGVKLEHNVYVTNGGKRQAAKMSKSYGNLIEIFAEGKPLKKMVMGVETDKKELEDPLDPDDDLVVPLYSLLATPDEVEEMRAGYRAGGYGYGNAKKKLLQKVNDHFGPYREKRKALMDDPDYVEDVLRDGARRARQVICATLDAMRAACGYPDRTSP